MEQFMPLVLTIAGTIILLLISAVAFFIIMIIREIKQNTKDVAKLSGIVHAQNEKHNGELRVIAERTELQIQQVTKNVDNLTTLMTKFIKQKMDS